ncbi:MAG: hypothetical protein V3V24_08345, partial [Nitrospinaceae bacterium]
IKGITQTVSSGRRLRVFFKISVQQGNSLRQFLQGLVGTNDPSDGITVMWFPLPKTLENLQSFPGLFGEQEKSSLLQGRNIKPL